MQPFNKQNVKRGFTLMEVLVVVIIGVLVTLFAVPAYKKMQDRTRYMAATGVLVEIASAAQMLKEAGLNATNIAVSSNATADIDAAPTAGTAVGWLQSKNYLGKIPFENGMFKGYTYRMSTSGSVTCSSNVTGWACMSGSNRNAKMACAYVDMQGQVKSCS